MQRAGISLIAGAGGEPHTLLTRLPGRETEGSPLDDAQRPSAYVSVSLLIRADEAVIPLYQRLTVDARNHLRGWRTNVDDYVTWNIQDWWLNQ